jgi:cell division protein YceG involved in septum cleavage
MGHHIEYTYLEQDTTYNAHTLNGTPHKIHIPWMGHHIKYTYLEQDTTYNTHTLNGTPHKIHIP